MSVFKWGVVYLIVLVLLGWYGFLEVEIDECVDLGGAWDESNQSCVDDPFRKRKSSCFESGGGWNYQMNICEH